MFGNLKINFNLDQISGPICRMAGITLSQSLLYKLGRLRMICLTVSWHETEKVLSRFCRHDYRKYSFVDDLLRRSCYQCLLCLINIQPPRHASISLQRYRLLFLSSYTRYIYTRKDTHIAPKHLCAGAPLCASDTTSTIIDKPPPIINILQQDLWQEGVPSTKSKQTCFNTCDHKQIATTISHYFLESHEVQCWGTFRWFFTLSTFCRV